MAGNSIRVVVCGVFGRAWKDDATEIHLYEQLHGVSCS